MTLDRDQLERAIAAQEGLRGVVADEVVDVAVASLRSQLEALDRGGQRRRQVTVLFADLQGFTALSESLDAEIVTDIINEVWRRVDGILTTHGGRIDKHIGDAVMALWGTDSAREDDPERAVRAALELQFQLAEHAAATGRQLTLRVGITTGPVLLGSVGTTNEFTAMGDTVNVASRLESAAPSGGVLISHDTYRHVRGVFDVSAQPPLQVKGKSDPLTVYIVRAAKPMAFRLPTRGVEGVETKMVERDTELDALLAALQRASAGELEVVTVRGEPGVGKSRLLFEFESRIELLDTPVYYFRARALPTAQTVPHGVVRNVIATRFGIVDRDDPEDVIAKLRAGFAPHLEAEQAELVGHWLGFDLSASNAVQRLRGSQGFGSVATMHLVRYFGELAAIDAVLFVLEDIHWADEESLDVIEALVTRLAQAHILVVAATRPTLSERRPGWFGAAARASTLDLVPLSSTASTALVRDVLQNVAMVPDDLAALIVDRADGNPFFVEELVKMLIDDGVVVPDPAGVWQLDLARFDPSRIPSTLTGLLEARLDSLGTRERSVLQRAAVIGRVFWDTAVSALEPDTPFAETRAALEVAHRREMVFPSDLSSLGVGDEYLFKHALLRDVTYETVLLRDRRRLHALAADWLSVSAGERFAEFFERIADQHELAGNFAAAASLYQRAGKRSIDSGASATARRLLDRARALFEAGSLPVSVDTRLLLAEANSRLGHLDDAEQMLAEPWPVELDVEQRADALYIASWVAAERGDLELERRLLEQAAPLAEAVGGRVLADVLLGQSWYEAGVNNFQTSIDLAERAIAIAAANGLFVQVGSALANLGMAEQELGHPDAAMRHAERAVEVARTHGDLEGESRAFGNVGVLYHLRADASGSRAEYEAAGHYYAQQVETAKGLDLLTHASWAAANLAQVQLRLGDESGAREILAGAIATLLEMGADLNFSVILSAELRYAAGDVGGALYLLGAVHSSPSARASVFSEIKRVLARFALDADAVEAGMRAGEGQPIEPLAREVLAELQHSSPS